MSEPGGGGSGCPLRPRRGGGRRREKARASERAGGAGGRGPGQARPGEVRGSTCRRDAGAWVSPGTTLSLAGAAASEARLEQTQQEGNWR